MKNCRWLCVISCLLLLPLSTHAQDQYEPSFEPPLGNELIAVFFSSSTCVANHNPEFDDAIREMKVLLSRQAKDLGLSFSVVGVALDWDPSTGTDYLMKGTWEGGTHDFGAFDEIVAGRKWGNSAAVKYMQRLSPEGCPIPEGVRKGVPQVFLVERRADNWRVDGNFTYREERFLLQLCGGDKIIEWVSKGAPVPKALSVAEHSG